MKKKSSRKAILLLILVAGFIVLWFTYLSPSLKVAAGYAAKYTCSYHFLSNVDQRNIDQALHFFPVKFATIAIDTVNKKVTTSFLGFVAKRTATYYEHRGYCGCILGENPPDIIMKQTAIREKSPVGKDSLFWPEGNRLRDSVPAFIDTSKLAQLLDSTLIKNSGVYAILVSYGNFLVGEQYQTGVHQDSRLLGWSMTKTITNALIGILQKNNKIDINDKSGTPEWGNDERKDITTNDLLQMSSGLKWSEDYSRLSNVTRMLYLKKDLPAYAEDNPLEYPIGEKWSYSSGTTNILSNIIRSKFGTYEQYFSFPYERLFDQAGMQSAVLETDNFGNYVLSSYCFATARDWTRFGLLYLNEGNWFGRQVFTPEWAQYSTTPATSSDGIYGAHIWLNASGKKLPSLPRDAYFENGFGGQRILIVPSKNVVITVMSGRENHFDFDSLYAGIFDCFETK